MEDVQKQLGYIDNSIKEITKKKLEMVKEQVETATFHFPEGDLNQEEAL